MTSSSQQYPRRSISSVDEVSLKRLFGLDDDVVAITGGGGQICSVLAHAIAKLGGKVAVLDLNLEAAQNVADQIARDGGIAAALQCDVLDKDSLRRAHDEILKLFGQPTVLINGAGGNFPAATVDPSAGRPFESIQIEAINKAFALNVTSAILGCQVFAPGMIAAQRGVILDVSSMCAFVPLTKVAFYSAAKAALQNFTQWFATHLCTQYCREGVRVVAIAPGFLLTEQNRFLLTTSTGELTPRGQAIINATPMGRFGRPIDLVAPVVFLLGAGAQFVTGTILPVDGGFHAYTI